MKQHLSHTLHLFSYTAPSKLECSSYLSVHSMHIGVQGSILPPFPLRLGCIFAFKLLKLFFQKIYKVHNSTDQTVCSKQDICSILITTFFVQ